MEGKSKLMPTKKLEWLVHFVLNLLLKRRDIVINDQLYLRRWYLWGRGTGAQWFLHNIRLPDEGREHHDHPWNFTTWILRGGYTESVLLFHQLGDFTRMRTHRAGDKVVNDLWHKHRIDVAQPNTYTLVRAGLAQKLWGFLIPSAEEGSHTWVWNRIHLGIPLDAPEWPEDVLHATPPVR